MTAARISIALAIPLAGALAGCAMTVDSHSWVAGKVKDSYPSLVEPAVTPRESNPAPDVKAIVAKDITAVFGRTTVKDVKVGPARSNGGRWLACISADVVGIMNKDIGTKVFVVEFDRGKVDLRRPATAEDRCEADHLEPI
jgi:hypothetical protein